MTPDLFVTERFHALIYSDALDPKWTDGPRAAERIRLLVWILTVVKWDGDGYPIGRRGGRFIRGWNPDVKRNDVALRQLLKDLAGGAPPDGLYNVDRYSTVRAPRGGSRPRGRATAVSSVELPTEILEAGANEVEEGADAPLVHAITGKPFNPKLDRPKLFQAAVEGAMSRCVSDTPGETLGLLDYLHARSVKAFSSRFKRVHAELVDHARSEQDPDVRIAALRTIKHLRLQPVPVYRTTGGTQRLSPHGLSLAGADRWIRRRVLHDCVEIDMSSAQLAIVAALWDVPIVRDFLAGGHSIWDELTRWLIGQHPKNRFALERDGVRLKGLLKVMVYGVCFGMREKNLARWGNPNAGGPKEREEHQRDLEFVSFVFRSSAKDVGAAFISHPLVRDLLEARRRKMAAVSEAGGLTDLFGRRYVLGARKEGAPRGEKIDVKSALAAEAQAAEHRAMLGVAGVFIAEAERAEATSHRTGPEAQILLWQADGVSVRVRQRGRWRYWVERANDGLQDALREIESSLGSPTINTRLVVDHEPE